MTKSQGYEPVIAAPAQTCRRSLLSKVVRQTKAMILVLMVGFFFAKGIIWITELLLWITR